MKGVAINSDRPSSLVVLIKALKSKKKSTDNLTNNKFNKQLITTITTVKNLSK